MIKIKNDMINSRNRVFSAIVKVIKKRFKPVHILFIALLLTSNSFAWFIYMNKIDSDINVRVKAWNVSFRFDNETMTDYINFSVDEIYPGMDDFEQVLSVTNDGDVAAKLSYEIISINIFGEDYSVLEDNITSSDLNDMLTSRYPFKISITSDSEIIASNGGMANFIVRVVWPYESYDDYGNINDEVDTYWGNQAYQFSLDNKDVPCVLLKVKLTATQIEN